MNLIKKFVLIAIMLMLVATIFIFGNGSGIFKSGSGEVSESKKQELTGLAKQKFTDEKNKGTDMSKGPCLGTIAIGWVVDIAHSPRTADDDKPENQCSDYLSGHVSHFIELDTKGELIKIN